MNAKSGTFLSVVIPLHDDADIAESLVTEVMAVLSENYQFYELVLVDDCSSDLTQSVISDQLTQHSGIRLIRLSRRCGTDIAITAGLESSIGDFVVVMDAASDPPSEIPRMVQYATQERASDVVLGHATNARAEGWLFQGLRVAFHFIAARWLGLNFPRQRHSLRGLTRRAVNAITRVKQKQRHLSLLCCSIGYRQSTFEYQKAYRTNRPSQRKLREAIDLGLAAVVMSSISPLRLVTYTGVLAGMLNLAYVAYVFLVNLVKPDVAQGWTTLSLQISTMFVLVFAILVVMSEYISRILDEAQERPLYHVVDELTSTTSGIQPQLRNVIENSITIPLLPAASANSQTIPPGRQHVA